MDSVPFCLRNGEIVILKLLLVVMLDLTTAL